MSYILPSEQGEDHGDCCDKPCCVMEREIVVSERGEKRGHTATPYFFSGEGYPADHGIEFEVATEEGRGVWVARTQNKADAVFIVKACNAYDNLLAALKHIQRKAHEGVRVTVAHDPNCVGCIARAAIKKATEVHP